MNDKTKILCNASAHSAQSGEATARLDGTELTSARLRVGLSGSVPFSAAPGLVRHMAGAGGAPAADGGGGILGSDSGIFDPACGNQNGGVESAVSDSPIGDPDSPIADSAFRTVDSASPIQNGDAPIFVSDAPILDFPAVFAGFAPLFAKSGPFPRKEAT